MLPPLSEILRAYTSGAYEVVAPEVAVSLGDNLSQIGHAIDFINWAWLQQHSDCRAELLKNIFIPLNVKVDLQNVSIKELYEFTYCGDKYFGIEAPLKVLICGDREWGNAETIMARMKLLPKDSVIIEGEARGADKIAGECAGTLGLDVRKFPADWDKHGKAAGPIRNRQMLDQQPDLVIAFHENLDKSKGTADTVREAKKRGIPVEVITSMNQLTKTILSIHDGWTPQPQIQEKPMTDKFTEGAVRKQGLNTPPTTPRPDIIPVATHTTGSISTVTVQSTAVAKTSTSVDKIQQLEKLLEKWQKESKPGYAAMAHTLCNQLIALHKEKIAGLELLAQMEMKKFEGYAEKESGKL